jgi:hypothetical protein
MAGLKKAGKIVAVTGFVFMRLMAIGGACDDNLNSLDLVVNNDNLDGGQYILGLGKGCLANKVVFQSTLTTSYLICYVSGQSLLEPETSV